MRRNFGAAVLTWLEERTGLESAARRFLSEEIPASSGWRQVFGSVALFLFLLQVFTGILLAFNYAPTPGDAYNSLRYIVTEVTGGRLLRGLHHWGASLFLVLVVLHMTQVFLWGAYKKPREATWIAGVVLLQLALAFGLTGYLLPWDNRAYWGTVVTTQIAAKAPLVGPYLLRFLGSDGSIGVATFARFYTLHVLLLPAITALLIGFHVFLVRRHGVAPAPGDEDKPKKPFFPEQVFKDTVAIFAAFALLFLLAATARVPLERIADPTDNTYIPRPEWYFLFLFQLLKFFEGPLEVFASIVLPGLAILALTVTPFLDRGPAVRLGRRWVAFAVMGLSALVWTGLTAAAVATTPKQPAELAIDFSQPTGWLQLTPAELAGIGYFRAEGCGSCHPVAGRDTSKLGPDLTRTQNRKSAGWMIAHFKSPGELVPGSQMPPIRLADAQLNALAAFLLKLTPANAEAMHSAPDFAVQGAMLYQSHQCGACHRVNGLGMQVGPPLNGLSRRRTKSWVERHFREPQVMSPGTSMPAYPFSPPEMEAMVAYLFSVGD